MIGYRAYRVILRAICLALPKSLASYVGPYKVLQGLLSACARHAAAMGALPRQGVGFRGLQEKAVFE